MNAYFLHKTAENKLQISGICTRVATLNVIGQMGHYQVMDVRIYYEDTDAGGVVYHANYIKYMERARTEYFRSHGFLVAELADKGFVFPVVRLEIDFKSPALHDDLLSVTTCPTRISGSSATFNQKIIRPSDNRVLADGLVTLACIGPGLKAKRIPVEIRRMLEGDMENVI